MPAPKYSKNCGYLSLCYHYIRPEKEEDPFPRIYGTRINEFHRQILMLKNNYEIISLDQARQFSYNDYNFNKGKYGMLLTFDDGLSDHYHAAQILRENDIVGLFFIPTCILADQLPANPVIIHYCIAEFGIRIFLQHYRRALENHQLNIVEYDVPFVPGKNDPGATIKRIKSALKYRIPFKISRSILLWIYKNLFLDKYPQGLRIMHLTENQIYKMLDMGMYIGVHSHDHISVAANELDEKNFNKQVIEPKYFLENKFDIEVRAFSYPFGEDADCYNSSDFVRRARDYEMCFTAKPILNLKTTSPFELGRYLVHSTDNSQNLEKILSMIITDSKET